MTTQRLSLKEEALRAASKGLTTFITNNYPCSKGHTERVTKGAFHCTQCHREASQRAYEKNKERRKAQMKERNRRALMDILNKETWRRLGGSAGTFHEAVLPDYSQEDLIAHIESTFAVGMTWDNYGEWHIDHKLPIAYFDSMGCIDLKVINALGNLQALWKGDNKGKKDKLPHAHIELSLSLLNEGGYQ